MKYRLVNKEIRKNYVEELLRERGVEDVEEFLNPTEDSLESYSALCNIDKGVRLLLNNIGENAQVALITDSDVDGFTSSAIMYQYLKCQNPNLQIDYYIHSGKQHGLEDMWEKLQDKNYSLLIVPDASSNDSVYAEKLDFPVLVLDHHIVEGEITAPNMTVINNQISPHYHNKNLSGAGVVYQFCRAVDAECGTAYADNFIDLAAVGIISDMMDAREVENQYIWKKGLTNIKNPFLLALIDKQAYSIGGHLNPTAVAFYIAPLINSMIRVGTQEEKERMFLAFIDGERLIPSKKRGANGAMEHVAVESARECVNARAKQNRLLEAAETKIEAKIHKHGLLDNKILLIRLEEDDDFPPELNGLWAMKMANKYKRPTLVLRMNDNGELKGSGRGVNNSPIEDFKGFLNESGYMLFTAGHSQAFGSGIKDSDLSAFHAWANNKLTDVALDESCFDVNFVRSAADKDISDIVFDTVLHADCFGQCNDEPRLYIRDINITQNDVQIIGQKKDTVKFTKFGITYIKFHADDFIQELSQYKEMKLEVVGRGNINEWMGTQTVQIMIDGYEVHDGSLGF